MAKRGNGEGSIFYSEPHQRWIGQFNNGYKDNGKLNRKTIYGKTRKEVKEKMLELQNLVVKEKYCDKSEITFYDLAKDILDTKYASNRICENSYRRLLATLELFKPFYHRELQKITPGELQHFLNPLSRYSSSSIDKIFTLLNQIFREAIKRKIINSNPTELIMKPKTVKVESNMDLAFSLEEEQKILESLKGEKFENILMIAFHTGMRIGEILALTPEDIDFEKKVIKINKTLTKDMKGKAKVGEKTKTKNGMRIIPYIDELEPYLKDAVDNYEKNPHHLLFHDNGRPIANSIVNSQFKRICSNLNILVKPRVIVRPNKSINSKTSDAHLHMIRHTYATRCIESGMPAVVLQRLLGHHDVSITLNTYTSVFNAFQVDSLNSYVSYMSNANTNAEYK